MDANFPLITLGQWDGIFAKVRDQAMDFQISMSYSFQVFYFHFSL